MTDERHKQNWTEQLERGQPALSGGMGDLTWNTTDIRGLLKALDDADLTALCQDEFPELCDKFRRGMSKDEKINAIIDHFRCREDFASLVDAVKEREPELYDNYEIVLQKRLSDSGPEAATDTFTQYEMCLTKVLERLGSDHPRYTEALVLQSRLLENISQAWRYGNTDTRRAERAQIMDSLNQLVLDVVGVSFNELCKKDANQRERTSPLAGPTPWIGSCRFKVEVFVAAVLLVIVGLCSTVGRPVLEGWAAAWSLIPPKAPAVTPSGPEITVKASGTAAISANARGATAYSWTLYGVGRISRTEGPVIFYTAPNELGVAILSVMAHNDRGASPPTSLILNVSCPTKANAEGTVSPAVAISSITFAVNGDEQVANDFGSPQLSSGDRLEVREITICVDLFKDVGGAVFVEFDPVDQGGRVMASEVRGTRVVAVAPGFTTIPGPDYTWTIGDNW